MTVRYEPVVAVCCLLDVWPAHRRCVFGAGDGRWASALLSDRVRRPERAPPILVECNVAISAVLACAALQRGGRRRDDFLRRRVGGRGTPARRSLCRAPGTAWTEVSCVQLDVALKAWKRTEAAAVLRRCHTVRYEPVVEGDALGGVRASIRAKGVPPASRPTMPLLMSPAGATVNVHLGNQRTVGAVANGADRVSVGGAVH